MPVAAVANHERIWIESLNRGDVSAADLAFSPDCTVHITGVSQPVRGVAAWKELVGGLLSAFPDLHFTIDEQIGDETRIAFRWHAEGTHKGPFGPIPPTNRPVAISGLIIDHLRDGKVVERWEQWDQSVMLQQLGVA